MSTLIRSSVFDWLNSLKDQKAKARILHRLSQASLAISGIANRWAKASGLGRESLYKTLAPGAKPRFETIATIMRALNVGFSVESRLAVRAKKARKLKAA
jgi:probable addiction module antidote protein